MTKSHWEETLFEERKAIRDAQEGETESLCSACGLHDDAGVWSRVAQQCTRFSQQRTRFLNGIQGFIDDSSSEKLSVSEKVILAKCFVTVLRFECI